MGGKIRILAVDKLGSKHLPVTSEDPGWMNLWAGAGHLLSYLLQELSYLEPAWGQGARAALSPG